MQPRSGLGQCAANVSLSCKENCRRKGSYLLTMLSPWMRLKSVEMPVLHIISQVSMGKYCFSLARPGLFNRHSWPHGYCCTTESFWTSISCQSQIDDERISQNRTSRNAKRSRQMSKIVQCFSHTAPSNNFLCITIPIYLQYTSFYLFCNAVRQDFSSVPIVNSWLAWHGLQP